MAEVKLTRKSAEMRTVVSEALSPHPTFQPWTRWDVYPYQFHGSMRRLVEQRKYFLPTIENDFLRVSVNADVGGRVWDVYDKVAKRHVINFNNEVHNYNAGFGSNYTSGGLEYNYPHAHACTTSRPREIATRRNPDGSASIVVSEFERIWRTRWSVVFTLYPDRSYLESVVRIYNRSPMDSRYMYWSNCGFYLNDNVEYIFPEDAGAMHGAEAKTFSWPQWKRRDLNMWRNTPSEMLGIYMLDAREPFFGYYDHGDQFGLVHYGDLADLPGKKTWTWSTHPDYLQFLRDAHHGLGKVYGEMQSGRIVIQEHLDRVPPETECEWREIWFPVRNTGGFNGAGVGAAMSARVVEQTSARTVLKLSAMGNGFFPEATAHVVADGLAPNGKPFPLDPRDATTDTVVVAGQAGPDQNARVFLRDSTGEILASCPIRRPNKRDSWREVYDGRKPVKPVGAEQIFMEAEKLARDWGNHDLWPEYEKALECDAGFSPACRELGKLSIWRGRYVEAVALLRKALERDEDSLELQYYFGLAHLFAGNASEARKGFEMANRYHWQAAAQARLAELRMREGDFHHALQHFKRLREAGPRLTRPRALAAACMRKLGRVDDAQAEIASARAIDESDPLLQIEALFLSAGSLSKSKLPKADMKSLLEQVRDQEPPLLEAAFDYLSAALFEEAEAVTRIIPKPGPLAMLLRAYAAAMSGRQAEAARTLKAALALDVRDHQIWRLEMFDILAWAAEQSPRHGRVHFLLGNLLMGRRRVEEAAQAWAKAVRFRETHWLCFANLGYHAREVAGDRGAALKWFQKAEKACPDDLYVKDEIAALTLAVKSPQAAIQYLEKNMAGVKASPKLANALLNAYLKLNRYDKFDALCDKAHFEHNWQIPGPHSLWRARYFQEALQLMAAGKPERALCILETLGDPPARLGLRIAQSDEEDRRFYHMGRCYEMMDQPAKARECWEKSVAVPHTTYYEHAYWYREWSRRYFQALSLQKLGRQSEAEAFFDGMEAITFTNELPVTAKDALMDMVERGRFAPDSQKDPASAEELVVETRAEE